MQMIKDNIEVQTMNKRNYGIDSLRLFSMYLVTVLHVLGQGGVLSRSTGAVFSISWLLETIAYCAVNCFGMISGYVGYTEEKKTYRFSKYISIWMQVVFYSFGIRLLYCMIRPELMEGRSLLAAVLPVTTCHYWYISAYTGLFFIIPWLNRLMRQCRKQEINFLIFVLFLVFSCYANCARFLGDVFSLGGGYSFVWLVILYLIGAWMKKCDIPKKVNSILSLASIVLCVVLTWIPIVSFPILETIFLSYISPTIVFLAVFLLILFSKIKFKALGERIIKMFAPAALGVYLLHVQADFWEFFMKGRFASIADSPAWQVPFLVLGAAGGIFIFCILVEKIRLTVFKVLRINTVAEKLVAYIFQMIIKVLNKTGIINNNDEIKESDA